MLPEPIPARTRSLWGLLAISLMTALSDSPTLCAPNLANHIWLCRHPVRRRNIELLSQMTSQPNVLDKGKYFVLSTADSLNTITFN